MLFRSQARLRQVQQLARLLQPQQRLRRCELLLRMEPGEWELTSSQDATKATRQAVAIGKGPVDSPAPSRTYLLTKMSLGKQLSTFDPAMSDSSQADAELGLRTLHRLSVHSATDSGKLVEILSPEFGEQRVRLVVIGQGSQGSVASLTTFLLMTTPTVRR